MIYGNKGLDAGSGDPTPQGLQPAGEGVTITRGAPLGYLNRYPTASPPYWSKYLVFNPFTFTVDGVVMWTIIVAGYKLAGEFKRNQRGESGV